MGAARAPPARRQGEQRDLVFAQVKTRGEHQGRRGPEHVESGEHQGVEGGAPAQLRRGAQETGQACQHAQVGYSRAGIVGRHGAREGQSEHGHQGRGDPEDRAPARGSRDEQRRGPRQHDAGKKASHHVPDHPAAPCRRREVGREGNDDLRAGGEDANGEQGQVKGRHAMGAGRADQAERERRD